MPAEAARMPGKPRPARSNPGPSGRRAPGRADLPGPRGRRGDRPPSDPPVSRRLGPSDGVDRPRTTRATWPRSPRHARRPVLDTECPSARSWRLSPRGRLRLPANPSRPRRHHSDRPTMLASLNISLIVARQVCTGCYPMFRVPKSSVFRKKPHDPEPSDIPLRKAACNIWHNIILLGGLGTSCHRDTRQELPDRRCFFATPRIRIAETIDRGDAELLPGPREDRRKKAEIFPGKSVAEPGRASREGLTPLGGGALEDGPLPPGSLGVENDIGRRKKPRSQEESAGDSSSPPRTVGTGRKRKKTEIDPG